MIPGSPTTLFLAQAIECSNPAGAATFRERGSSEVAPARQTDNRVSGGWRCHDPPGRHRIYRKAFDPCHGRLCEKPHGVRAILESLVTGRSRKLTGFLANVLAGALLFAIALANVTSAVHQAEFDVHSLESLHDLTAAGIDEPEALGDIGSPDTETCSFGLQCHAPVATIGYTERVVPPRPTTQMEPPERGLTLDSRTAEVITPPPLAASA